LAEAARIGGRAAAARRSTLLGQNGECYHGIGADGESWRWPQLIWALDEIEGLARHAASPLASQRHGMTR